MELILLERIKGLGNLGDKVKVKAGFGRNYLLPTEKAVIANEENLAYFESRRAELEKRDRERYEASQSRAESLDGLQLKIAARASEEGRLYGSVGIVEIADVIKSLGKEVNKQEIQLPSGPFRTVGEYEVEIHLHHSDLIPKVAVSITREGQEEESALAEAPQQKVEE